MPRARWLFPRLYKQYRLIKPSQSLRWCHARELRVPVVIFGRRLLDNFARCFLRGIDLSTALFWAVAHGRHIEEQASILGISCPFATLKFIIAEGRIMVGRVQTGAGGNEHGGGIFHAKNAKGTKMTEST